MYWLSESLNEEDVDADRFIQESNINIIKNYVETLSDNPDDPDEALHAPSIQKMTHPLMSGLGKNVLDTSWKIQFIINVFIGPDITTMGLTLADRENETRNKVVSNYENVSIFLSFLLNTSYCNAFIWVNKYSQLNGELEVEDLDDDELDSYIMSDKETQFKHKLWHKVNAEYLTQQKGIYFNIFNWLS